MTDDERLAAFARDLETIARQVEAGLSSRDQQSLRTLNEVSQRMARQLRGFTPSAKFRADFETFQQSYQHAIDQTAQWTKQIAKAARPTAPPSTVERRVQALQADAPAAEPLQAAQEELERILAAQQALRPKRQEGQRNAAAKRRRAAIAWFKAVERRRHRKTPGTVRTNAALRPGAAVRLLLSKKRAFHVLSQEEQAAKVKSELQRYTRGRQYHATDKAAR